MIGEGKLGAAKLGWLGLGTPVVILVALLGKLLLGAPPPPPLPPADAGTPASVTPRHPQVADPSRECLSRMLRPLGTWSGHPTVDVEDISDGGADAASRIPDAATEAASSQRELPEKPRRRGGDAPVADAGVAPLPAKPAMPWLEDAITRTSADLAGAMTKPPILDVRVATITDPVDSGLRYYYDTTLQALRLGVERGEPAVGVRPAFRYYRDASFLPWDDRRVPEAKRVASEDCRDTTPGLVLFRGDPTQDGTPRFAVLLLVGETPTTGVHQVALINALRIADVLQRRSAEPVLRKKLVGPTFSGSASSMRAALDAWASTTGGKGEVSIVSGSASGQDVPATLEGPPEAKRKMAVTFTRTTRAERDVTCAFLTFARRHLGIEPGHDGIMRGVAFLHESGTEFGAAPAVKAPGARGACDVRAEISLSFPFHVSALRDAYEAMDQQNRPAQASEVPGRRTTLDVRLHEPRKPIDIEADPSPRTTFAEDVALTNMLSELSREGARYVGVQATDVADAIFVARKIRDVAPDVRLVFYESDALLAHPAFRRDLVGSIVVSPYPFFGSDDFSRGDTHNHEPFESGLAEGVFNAVLALERFPPDALHEYAFFQALPATEPLPIRISTIANTGLVPVEAQIHAPPRHTYRGANVSASSEDADSSDEADPPGLELRVDPDRTPPNFWHFVYAAVMALAFADQLALRRWRVTMQIVPLADVDDESRDAEIDLALGRAKFHFYATIRGIVFAVALLYLGSVHALALSTYDHTIGRTLPKATICVGLAALTLSLWTLGRRCARYLRQERTIARFLRKDPYDTELFARVHPSASWLERDVDHLWRKVAPWLGFQDSDRWRSAARASLQQLRVLGVIAFLVTAGFFALLVCDLVTHGLSPGSFRVLSPSAPTPKVTLFVLRALPLTNGVSPSTPVLLSLACVYVWVVGRMARLTLVHSLSLISPPDGINDAVSTPIRFILFPTRTGEVEVEDFTRVERRLLNAILRPGTGARYFVALLGLSVFPFLLFALKRPSTLESPAGTYLLYGALCLSGILIAATLLQFALYWMALEVLLKRILGHPLGRGFRRVEAFVRESVEDQISRSPNDLLRLAAAADKFDDLARRSAGLPAGALSLGDHDLGPKLLELAAEREPLAEARATALGSSPGVGRRSSVVDEWATRRLGRGVIVAAASACRMLDLAYDSPSAPETAASASTAPPKEDDPDKRDALSPLEGRMKPEGLAWLREAQSFVATVVAILVGRHVRQFRYFMYTLTATALLLLLSLTSYAFEPYRLLLTCIWVIMGAVVGTGFWVYLELERNALLSLISGTTPDKVAVSSSLVLRVVGWVILPLLTVAAAQYPEVGQVLFSWVEPFARALR